MQLDKNAVQMLLALDDAQLRFVINRVAVNIGIDTEYFGLKNRDVNEIRRRLTELTDSDFTEAQRQIDAKSKGNNGGR